MVASLACHTVLAGRLLPNSVFFSSHFKIGIVFSKFCFEVVYNLLVGELLDFAKKKVFMILKLIPENCYVRLISLSHAVRNRFQLRRGQFSVSRG